MIKVIRRFVAAVAFSIGRSYCERRGDSKDYETAYRWIRFAAERNHIPAQVCMGAMCALGEGTPKDDSEAAKWCRRAAENGHIFSQYQLAMMLYRGIGLDVDFPQAVGWFTRAIESGGLSPEHYELAVDLRAIAASSIKV